MSHVRRLFDRVARPEYTGENRCTPCTVLNLALAAVGSVLLGAAAGVAWGGPAAVTAGFAAALVAGAAIYLRGYLVPGTPAFTARYVPDRVLRGFGKPDAGAGDATADAVRRLLAGGTATGLAATADREPPAPDDVAAVLVEAGAVEDAGGPRLTDEFEAAWRREVEAVDDAAAGVADLVGADGPVELAPESLFSDTVVARTGEQKRKVGQWESRAAAVADVAAADLLAARPEAWSGLDPHERGAALYALRSFLEFCPDCGASVSPGWESVDAAAVPSCCRGGGTVAVECGECGARLVENDDAAPAPA